MQSGRLVGTFECEVALAFCVSLSESFVFQLAIPRCHLPHLPSECFFWERQIDGIPVARETVDPRGPEDLDQVPLRIVEVERKRHTVIEGHLRWHTPIKHALVQGAKVRQRTDLEGGVLEGGVT